jgi:lipopolysaccharide/colanic/teichoic acid biosynthesis glycosyltransferase
MSLVGPRPESPERVKSYSEWQRQRLKVQAGVTGLAQVQGLREHHSSEEKTRFDLQYIIHWSPFLDLSLLLQTVWTLLFRGLDRERLSSGPGTLFPQTGEIVMHGVADANRS